MAEAKSLLSLIARGYAAGREDAATEALRFILSRSASARDEFAKFLGDNGEPLPIAGFRTQQLVNGAYPDMACFDGNGNHVAFVESKFWASLTHRQPVNYWEALPDLRSATLLILAPAYRVAGRDEGSLWDILMQRLHSANHDLSLVDGQNRDDLVTATSEDGQRRLMLTSWSVLLDRLAEAAKKDEDDQASFEVAELRGLARDAINDEDPVGPDANLKQLIAEAVTKVKASGWANTDGLRTGGLDGVYFARYFRLGGAMTGLRIDYKAVKETRTPLWLWFWRDSSLSLDEVRNRLGASDEPSLDWLPNDVCVPIDLPAGLGRKAMLDAIVAELERVAKIIDPYVPTYHREPTTG